jgi:2',3'-cyclic-nucleotide 2'-phosphodiesterase (5'-nucleotidase family)
LFFVSVSMLADSLVLQNRQLLLATKRCNQLPTPENKAQKTRNIHLIISDHTHTFLDKPTEEKNLDGETVLVNQVGWSGINVCRIGFQFDKKAFAKKDVLIVE